MATAMATGEGAGTAAALAWRKHLTSREVNMEGTPRSLVRQGQYLLNENIDPQPDDKLILKRQQGSGERAGHFNPFAGKNKSK